MASTIPLTITAKAADYIAEHALEQPFQQMLDHIPQHFQGVHGIVVWLQPAYDVGSESVILDVNRDIPGVDDDQSEWKWSQWVIENFPPDEFVHFCLMSNWGPGDEG